MEQIGLRFLLRGGSFLGVVLPKGTALSYIATFQAGGSDPVLVWGGDGAPSSDGTYWCVKMADIQAIHTFALEQPKPAPKTLGGWTSGLNN